MHDPGAGCHDRDKCHLLRGFPTRWSIAVGSFDPEWPVPASFADFAAGRDRAMERILAAVAESLQVEVFHQHQVAFAPIDLAVHQPPAVCGDGEGGRVDDR